MDFETRFRHTYNVTDDELYTLKCRLGPLDNFYIGALMNALVLLRLENIQARLTSLEQANEKI